MFLKTLPQSYILYTLVIFLIQNPSSFCDAQEINNDNNLVNNPSFEDIIECPGDYGRIEDAIGWLALQFSPDLFHHCATDPKIGTPQNYFGNQPPSRNGKAYAGLLLYHDNSPLEFIGTNLVEPMEKKVRYKVSIKISWAKIYSNYACNNLGILFTNDILEATQVTQPDIVIDEIIADTSWIEFSKIITVDDNYQFIVIGNFKGKENTKTYEFGRTGYDGAYYYIDDIHVSKIAEEDDDNFIKVIGNVFDEETLRPINSRIDFVLPEINYRAFEESSAETGHYAFSNMQKSNYFFLEVTSEGYFSKRILVSNKKDPIIERNFYLRPTKVGNSTVIYDIFFESGKAEIKPQSYPSLDLLAHFLQENPGFKVEISGHTDNQGDEKKNQTLSKERAQAVVNYLIEKGFINAKRLVAVGYGSSQPIAENDTDEGRSKNRRVELKILE